jgi:hypothetical protein
MRMLIPGKNDGWLTNWLYDRAEWNRFAKWELLKKGGISLLLFLIIPFRYKRNKEVKVSQNQVQIDGRIYSFHAGNRVFQTADLYDAGPLHVLEICFKENEIYGVIRVPVPKGKLKEAIMLEKRLQVANVPLS